MSPLDCRVIYELVERGGELRYWRREHTCACGGAYVISAVIHADGVLSSAETRPGTLSGARSDGTWPRRPCTCDPAGSMPVPF